MTYIMVDIEADGPIPGDYSMVSFAAMAVTPSLDKSFYVEIKPISQKFMPDALKACNFTRDQTLKFDDPLTKMTEFLDWVNQFNRPMFISDNNGFDWQFINYYFHHFLGKNPFGFSSTNLGSLYKGMRKNTRDNFKHLRKTKHTHHALDDVRGNCEALLTMGNMGLRGII